MALFGMSENSIEAATAPRERPRDPRLSMAVTPDGIAALRAEPGPMQGGIVTARKPRVSGFGTTEETPVVALPPSSTAASRALARRGPVERDDVAERHGLFVSESKRGVREYWADHHQKQRVMRATERRITAPRSSTNERTVSAMLDLAQERGWASVRMRGTQEFRAEAWIQAQARGMKVEGFTPTDTTRQEVARRYGARPCGRI